VIKHLSIFMIKHKIRGYMKTAFFFCSLHQCLYSI
jgi:hypothetical protein